MVHPPARARSCRHACLCRPSVPNLARCSRFTSQIADVVDALLHSGDAPSCVCVCVVVPFGLRSFLLPDMLSDGWATSQVLVRPCTTQASRHVKFCNQWRRKLYTIWLKPSCRVALPLLVARTASWCAVSADLVRHSRIVDTARLLRVHHCHAELLGRLALRRQRALSPWPSVARPSAGAARMPPRGVLGRRCPRGSLADVGPTPQTATQTADI